ncbi:Calmodulin-regulated spectrin-associated protein 1-B [Triplophysa tibetana]|uniref:Calmodulin-regulated spectrin-associated protein 1-B n=1 Tax=Triplophysa tibetana TaxID=1572043 RepID=A0A5A9PDH5_9TELE|nr:Calmodulin-regulated spectrin-associated protein 1-B [Triplophysa tibetana]
MDVGAFAGADGGPRRVDSVEGGLEIVPLEMYDSARAKIEANLRWLFAKAYGEEHIPTDLRDPFYTDQYCVEHIKPPVLSLLLSSDLYCRVCALLLKGDQVSALTSHQAVIQTLARRGIYVREGDDTPVSHDDLSSTPIKMSSHIPLIDALMMAYMTEMMSMERVVSSVKRFSTFCASKDLPFDMEDAMLFWINKVILKTRELSEKDFKMKQPLIDSPCHQKVRYRRDHLSGHPVPHLTVIEDLLKDVCDGAALLTVVHFYCPEYMKLDDICLKEVASLSDSVYNIHLLKEFSSEYLNRCFYLNTEDLLYGPPVLKQNLLVFIAELFWWFEVVKPEFVKPKDLQEMKDVRASLQPKSCRPHVPISNATKRSFMTSSPSADSLATVVSPDGYMRTKGSPANLLLPLRQRQQNQGDENSEVRNRSNSLSRMDALMLGSQLAWAERKHRPISQMETEWERLWGDDVSLARSISKDSLASNVISITPRHRINGQPLPQTHHYDNHEEEEELVAVINPVAASRDGRPEGFFLEPLQSAVLRPNKEKTGVSKREESGEGRGHHRKSYTPTECVMNRIFMPINNVEQEETHTQSPTHSGRFFLHDDAECMRVSPVGGWKDVASDSEFEEDDVDQELARVLLMHPGKKCMGRGDAEEESVKLREDVCLREREDKEGTSGRASPCPSVASQASSTSTGRMTSFAERRRHRVGLPDGCHSTASSQTTTPDGSESAQFPSDMSPGTPVASARPGLASEIVHLRMQLEEKRRAIEKQKKKMEIMSARQRMRLGKAAFLHVVKKGRSDTLPHPLKQQLPPKAKTLAKDDACVEILKARAKNTEQSPGKEITVVDKDNRLSVPDTSDDLGDSGGEPDLSECSRSIELLNEAIGAIQQQMMQLSVQQDLIIKQAVQSPQEHATKANTSAALERTRVEAPPLRAIHRDPFYGNEKSSETPSGDPRPFPGGRTPRAENEEEGGAKDSGRGIKGIIRNTTFRLQDTPNLCSDSLETPQTENPLVEASAVDLTRDWSESGGAGKENFPVLSEENKTRALLIEVDLSELADQSETGTEPDGEQKSGLGFFFKDDQKAEDELAKKRAAFLLKQQRKAEETRKRKEQLEAESELKRDEARRKAEEDRVRKEEEKARRELIKQEYLRKKQQELLEEQGVAKPRPRPRRPRPKSLHRAESSCSAPVSLCSAPSGSSLSLASAATEGDSVASGGASSHRGESVESFPMLSRNASRNMERDWDNGSTASSITSVAEYNGPRLFKEPSAKSNKPIIQNAIAHCCLAGKVNESQKNAILEASVEIERCESNHLIILFRDSGCQFRALYTYFPETEEILKLKGTGPRSISRKMIDRFYKYSSDRKQFTVIPAKSISASVDALTIHGHLWQAKRPSTSKRK